MSIQYYKKYGLFTFNTPADACPVPFGKFLKKKVLAGFHYPAKEDFINAIDNFIDEVNEGV